MGLDTIDETEGGRVDDRGPRSSLDQAGGDVPLLEAAGVSQGRTSTQDGTGCFDVSTRVEEGVEHGDVVAARRPVERRFFVRTSEPGVHVGAGLHEKSDDGDRHGILGAGARRLDLLRTTTHRVTPEQSSSDDIQRTYPYMQLSLSAPVAAPTADATSGTTIALLIRPRRTTITMRVDGAA